MTEEVRAKIGSAVTGENNPNWIDGSWRTSDGRVYVWVPYVERSEHPTIRSDGYVRRSHYAWNKAHPEDPVRQGQVVHHRNEVKDDDRPENLHKTVQSDHAREHGVGRRHTPEARERMSRAQTLRRQRERGEI
jgi:hypothetical protein